jgi:hypothetical protein
MAFFSRLLLTLFGMAFALLLTLGVFCWLALFVAFASVRWLVTGQKPQVVMMWQQVNTMRKGMQSAQGARWSRGTRRGEGSQHEADASAQRSGAKSDVVEDVEVREIREKRYLPKD